MQQQRRLLLLLATLATVTTAGVQAGNPFKGLLGLVTGIPAGQVEAPLSSGDGPRGPLLPPLWNIADLDLHGSLEHVGRVLQQAPGDEVSASAADPDPDPQPNPSRRALKNDDFVFAAPSTPSRLSLVQASRYWRKGMRAVFVLDQPTDQLPPEMAAGASQYRESFAWFPNFRRMANNKRDHYLEGDRRAAMTPVLAYAALAEPASMTPWAQPAHPSTQQQQQQVPAPQQAQQSGAGVTNAAGARQRSLAAEQADPAVGGAVLPAPQPPNSAIGNQTDPFQWMLMGDDDTIWFMRGVKALLRDYDPQLPYFISDSMYIGSLSPQPGVWEMRCYPCHLPWGRWRRSGSRRLLEQDSNGCDCSTESLCKRRFPDNATRCQTEWEGPVPWGGVGFIFSIGLFKKLAAMDGGKGLKAYEACINAPETSVMSFPEGGDAFMSRCLWRLGFPVTDPGYTPLGRYMGELLHLGHLYEAPANLSKGQLPPDALKRWSMAVSMHLGARQQRSFRAAAMTIKYISAVYDLVAELLWPTGRKAEL